MASAGCSNFPLFQLFWAPLSHEERLPGASQGIVDNLALTALALDTCFEAWSRIPIDFIAMVENCRGL